jgi:uncharacterized protein
MRVAVTGATGTIGRALVKALLERRDSVVALSRDEGRARQALDAAVEVHAWPRPTLEPPPAAALSGADVVVNLLGEPLAQRWSDAVKREIRDSRVLSTRQLITCVQSLTEAERPRVLVSQSATGFYGAHGDEPLDEQSPPGEDFLSRVVVDWEAEAQAVTDLMRVAVTRTGVVLSPEGGALAQMLPFFKAGLGGPVAGGRQYLPWVHVDDVVGALLFCADHQAADGAINVTAPEPVRNADFAKALSKALRRPAFLPVPKLGLKALYGEMSVIVTTGARVLPERLKLLGYSFRQPDLGSALAEIISRL